MSAGNADAAELDKFARLAARWWDPDGPCAPLHAINPLRLAWIEQQAGDLSGRRVVDVGCGGGILAEAMAARGADVAIVTSDNPRTEAPVAILNDIRDGVQRPDAMRWIVDREEAIQAAADEVAPGDVVVIAGKGHETTQTIGTDTRPFDDREMARRYFG